MYIIANPRNFRAQISVFYHFMLEGVLVGIWGSFLPSIQENLSLSDSELGSAVLFVYFGTVAATPVAAILMRRLGSRLATAIGAISFGVSLPFIALAGDLPVLILAMVMTSSL